MKKTSTPVMKWMKKNIGLGASISHFIVREENGVYITTCSLANARKEEWIDLTMDEIKTVALDRRARCGKCEYSPRTIPPEKFWVEPS